MSERPVPPPGERPDELPGQLRRLRRARQWSLQELGAAAGVSRSMLSQIERGEANPTLAVAARISRALGVSLDELAGAAGDESPIEVIRADDHAFDYRSDPECRIRTLSPRRLEREVEFYEITLAGGHTLDSAAHVTGAFEFLAVERGTVTVRSGAARARLGVGDSASYRADVAHAIENPGTGPAVAFLVVRYLAGPPPPAGPGAVRSR